MFDSHLFVGDNVVFYPSKYKKGMQYSLHSLFGLLARGWDSQDIRQQYPDVLPETILEVRNILIKRTPDFFPDTVSDRRFRDFRVLVDENISPNIVNYLRMHFNKVSHVSDVGLTGKKDDKVWEWALNNECNIIFTKDSANLSERDLTYIAVQDAKSILRAREHRHGNNFTLSDLPLIIHLSGKVDPLMEIKKLLRRGRDEFYCYLENRATPYLAVNKGKISCGPTFFELRGKTYLEDRKLSEVDFAEEKMEAKELFKAMWLSRLSVDEIRNMKPEREEKIDRQIESYEQRPRLPELSRYLLN